MSAYDKEDWERDDIYPQHFGVGAAAIVIETTEKFMGEFFTGTPSLFYTIYCFLYYASL